MIDANWNSTAADAALTIQEEAILLALRSAPDRVLSRTELARAAGLSSAKGRRVDALLVSIRRSLDNESIINIRNRGWRLVIGAESDSTCARTRSPHRVTA